MTAAVLATLTLAAEVGQSPLGAALKASKEADT